MAKNISSSIPKRFYFVSAVIILILIFIFGGRFISCKKLGCIYITGLNSFQLKDVYQDDKDIYRALYDKNSDLIRIEIRSIRTEDEANKSIEAQTARMIALFENAAAPYPGEISNEIVCDKKYKPVYATGIINGTSITHFTGYLNARLTFGACTEDQAIYRGIDALFYCNNQQKLYQLEIISPTSLFTDNESKYIDMLKSIQCK